MANKIDLELKGLLGPGNALVIRLPNPFNLSKEITSAKQIKLATAFAHWSGWQSLKPSIEKTRASVKLLTGLSFCQTEPRVLSDWWRLGRKDLVKARLFANKSVTFHPKILIVKTGARKFVVVGSGNLSGGGFQDNIECSLYSDEKSVYQQVDKWFETLFANDNLTKQLREPDIRRYKPRYDAARKARNKVQELETEAEGEIGDRYRAGLGKWRGAVRLARNFFRSRRFKEHYRDDRSRVAARIKAALNYPTFRFDKAGLDRFFAISSLGHLISIPKPWLWQHRRKLQQGLRWLIDDSKPVESRLHEVLDSDGRFRVGGASLNFISKILAVHDPSKYTVFNRPIAEALRHFNYDVPRGYTPAEKYQEFADTMRQFLRDCGARNTLDLDAFFYEYWAKHIWLIKSDTR